MTLFRETKKMGSWQNLGQSVTSSTRASTKLHVYWREGSICYLVDMSYLSSAFTVLACKIVLLSFKYIYDV